MTNTVYSLSISARAVLNLHSLNNEGGEGNQIQTRMVDIVYYDDEQNPQQANVNAISGDMLKHIQVEHLHRISSAKKLPLCSACKKLNANRMNAAPEFRTWINEEKRTQVEVVNRLIHDCVIDDMAGNLVTEGGLSAPRKSVAEFGWVVGIPEAVTTDEYFHVKYVPDNRETAKEDDERTGNLGQNIFHRPASSGVYAIVVNLETARIGYNDITQKYLEGVDRKARYAALLESLLYTFVEMNGAMRNTQMPHLVALHGVVTVSKGIAPAPTISPINPNFAGDIQKTKDAINAMHETEVISVSEFRNVGELAEIMGDLVKNTEPYTLEFDTNS